MFTLGLIPSIGRNFLILAGLIPTLLGNNGTLITAGYALGGILLSHPFEVARVIVQHKGAGAGMFGDSLQVLRGLYSSEGIAGLYRGAVPRTIHQLPTLMSLIYLQRAIKPAE
jgi:hypothetical protein